MAGLLYPSIAARLPEVVRPAAAPAILLIRGAPLPALEAAARDVLTPQWNVWIPHWVTKVTTQNTLKPFLLATKRLGSLQESRASVLQYSSGFCQ